MTTWFPCRHPDEVRIAQTAVVLRCRRGLAATLLIAMAFGAMLHAASGWGWRPVVWQLAMSALAVTALLHTPSSADSDGPLHAAWALLAGLCIAGGIWIPMSALGHEFSALGIAALLTIPAYAIAAGYVVPIAVIAFSAPLAATAIVAILASFPALATVIAIVLAVCHCGGLMWFLRKNWDQFSQLIDADVESRRVTAMLRQQKEFAEQAVQLKTRFLAAASHDLRQPMHAISLYLGGLAELDLPARAREAVNDARECAHDINDMFRSLLDISRLDARQAVPTFNVFSLSAMLARVEKEFSPLAHSRSVKLVVRSRDHHAYSDPVMVERIAQNFVSNAIRHAAGGRVLACCRVMRGDTIRLAVYDNGKGIPLDQQQLIFNEFHRLDPSRQPDHTGGLGLGLAIVRRLADSLRIPVTVKSSPGRGSMFAVDLPLVHVHSHANTVISEENALQGKLVILVDDEVPILQAASFMLEGAGCSVVSARSCREAMDALATTPRVPDAIVCDYELHDEHKGTAVIRALREEFNTEIPALLVTGHTADGLAERNARELGIELLYKPLESSTLRSSLGSLLAAKH